jgi:hypothetical protein
LDTTIDEHLVRRTLTVAVLVLVRAKTAFL